jgi:acyl dehydratase
MMQIAVSGAGYGMLGPDRLAPTPGETLGVSGWKTIAQDRIDRFAEATEDFQFIHLDAARAAAETPFGGTIAHGFLALSLVSALAQEALPPTPGLQAAMIMAVDRVKFISPVRAGGQVRAQFVLDRLVWMSQARAAVKVHVTLEIKDQPEPALRCDVTWLLQFEDQAAEAVAEAGPA